MSGSMNIGVIIKHLRVERKMTQKQLAGTTCSEKELSRIEKGKVNPSPFVYRRLLELLGEDPDKYIYNFANVNEEKNYNRIIEIRRLIADRKMKEAKEKIDILKSDKTFNCKNKFNRQIMLRFDATMLSALDNKHGESLSLLREAAGITLKITGDDYIEAIQNNVLVTEEVVILHLAAQQFRYLGNHDYAIDMLTAIKENIERNFTNTYFKPNAYHLVLFTLSGCLGLDRHTEKAVEICDLGIEYCRKTNSLDFLGLFYFHKGCGLHDLGQVDECKEFFRTALELMKASDDMDTLKIAKEQLSEIYKVSL